MQTGTDIMNQTFRKLAMILLTLSLSACATTKAPPGLNLGSDNTLHVEDPVVENLDLTLEGKGSAVVKGTALGVVGAAGGAVVGATGGFILGIACGPMFIVCSPMAAVAGAGVVGAGGGAMGAAYGGKGFTSGDKGERFNTHVEKGFEAKKLSWTLYDHLVQDAERRWQLDPVSDNVVSIRVTSIRMEQLMEQQVQLVLEAEMTATINGETRLFRINQASPDMHIDGWLVHDGRVIWTAVDSELAKLSQTVVQTLVRAG
jgi:hypothetical protein